MPVDTLDPVFCQCNVSILCQNSILDVEFNSGVSQFSLLCQNSIPVFEEVVNNTYILFLSVQMYFDGSLYILTMNLKFRGVTLISLGFASALYLALHGMKPSM